MCGGDYTRQTLQRCKIWKRCSFSKDGWQKRVFGDKSDSLFGYAEKDIPVPEHLRKTFPICPIFENTNVCRQYIGPLKQEYAEKERLKSQFELKTGTIINSLLFALFELGLVCTKVYRFVEYTPVKCFMEFAQSVVDARWQRSVLLQKQWDCLPKTFIIIQ